MNARADLIRALASNPSPSPDAPMPDVANHADIALQDALTGDGGYDVTQFLASMRGNGYQITRERGAGAAALPAGHTEPTASPQSGAFRS